MDGRRYFALDSDCFLVKGALRGALYDLKSGNVFSVDEKSVKILEDLDSGKTFWQVAEANNDIGQEKMLIYLNNLQYQGLGEWNDVFKTKKPVKQPKEVLKYVLHLELTTGCNLRCLHCYNESEISKLYNNNGVSFNDWQRVISEAYQIGCRRVQFIGGEPFLKRKLMYELIPFARDTGYTSIEVSTNGTLITEKDLDFLKDYGVGLAFSFYSHKFQVHDLITSRNGSWKKTLGVVNKSLGAGIVLRINIVVMRQNEKDITKTAEFLRSLGVKYIKIDSVQAAGRGCSDIITDEVINRQIVNKALFAKTTSNVFWRNKAGHNCFSEQICIGSDGNIYPCLAEREVSYGNIKSTPFAEVLLLKTAKEIRGLSKDYIETCRDCEYRYCCFDCRVRALDFLKSDFHLKPWWCNYNPYNGKWEEKEIYLKGGEKNGREQGKRIGACASNKRQI